MSKSKASPLPHSWLVADWPAGVAPNRQTAARHLVRTHRDELIACGALCRVGRSLTMLGEGYATLLARRIAKVENYSIAPNRDVSAKAGA